MHRPALCQSQISRRPRASAPQLKRDLLGSAFTEFRLMRQVLRTSSVSFAESLRVALEAEDIPAVITNENSAGIMPTAVTVAVTDDADHERALVVLRSVEVTAPPFWLSNRRILRLLVAAIVAIAILVCLNL